MAAEDGTGLAHASLGGGTLPPPLKLRRIRRVRDQAAELAYLCCYPLVPAAFLVIYMNGSTGDVNRFWTAVLAAGFACYVSLPWVVSRPPRCLEEAASPVSAMRSINVRLLDRFSHGWNTFPSGHVAIAIAAALSTMSVAPRAGSAFLLVAIGILVGAVSGRYHYAVDAVAGAVVGIAAFAMALRIKRRRYDRSGFNALAQRRSSSSMTGAALS